MVKDTTGKIGYCLYVWLMSVKEPRRSKQRQLYKANTTQTNNLVLRGGLEHQVEGKNGEIKQRMHKRWRKKQVCVVLYKHRAQGTVIQGTNKTLQSFEA